MPQTQMLAAAYARPPQAASDLSLTPAPVLRRAQDWEAIYGRLAMDREDWLAWAALQAWVTLWARKGLGDLGREAIEDAVAEICPSVVEGFAKARGGQTFQGFVYGHYLDARQRLLRLHRAPLMPLDGFDRAEEVSDTPAPDEIALLRRLLGELPPRERRAVELGYLEGAGAGRIAAALGVSVVHARQLKWREVARQRLRVRELWPEGRIARGPTTFSALRAQGCTLHAT
jgi:DNA-directed RNA polymerase specialized sigma24 family protein